MFRVRKIVYLDNNATTKVLPQVRKRINEILEKCYGNPSSLYLDARNAYAILDESRIVVAKTVNAESNEIIFTSCASEANNTVINHIVESFPDKKILTTPIEHASVKNTLDHFKSKGVSVSEMPVDKFGFVKIEEMKSLIDKDTALIVVMYANNEIGTIQNVKQVSKIA